MHSHLQLTVNLVFVVLHICRKAAGEDWENVLAAHLIWWGSCKPCILFVSNQFKLDGFSVFSFSKLIYLRKRYKLSSAGSKFLSCLILLFVSAENSLVNVNHPLFCFAHLPRSLTNFLFTSV